MRWNFSAFYFLTFFGIGSLYPLLTVYLDENIGLTGSQIGVIMSISPVVMIIVQPMWGMLSDWTQKPKVLLTIAIVLTSLIGFIYSFMDTYVTIFIIAIFIATAQSAIVPLSDSITLNYVQKVNGNYGSFRLWGALGFAISVLVVGRAAEFVGLTVIFYSFAIVLFLSTIFSWRLPGESQRIQTNLFQGIHSLGKRPRFLLFLLTTFLIFGPIYANNFYFGLLIKDLGGTLTGVGIAFLLAAGSEAPFMQYARKFIQRVGMLHVLLIAASISMIRWYFYFYEPSLFLVYATTIAQGISVGLFIPAALQYVRDISPKEVHITAVSLYSAIGNGLGSWFCTYFGGIILELNSIQAVYLFYGVLTTFGVITLLAITRIDHIKRRTALRQASN
ncbi:MFS transporter [Bacillus salitolerans]|uniref:MFS transporter n=1 Tax=Bacillus salitolerans TaxID=1437434 RepID=A0ABW4LVR8_9BACI